MNNPDRDRVSPSLGVVALLVLIASGKPRTQGDPGPTVTITGPTTAYADTIVALTATVTGLEEPIAYSWSIASGDAFVIEQNGSSASIHASGFTQVVVRVIADGGASGTAEGMHYLEFVDNSGRQKPNDFNGDGNFDISDPVALLEHIFSGGPSPPCGDGRLSHPSNLVVLDANGSGEIDISDPVFVLNFLFLGGPTPVNCIGDVTCPCFPTVDCFHNEACS